MTIFYDGDSARSMVNLMPGFCAREGDGRLVPISQPQPMLAGVAPTPPATDLFPSFYAAPTWPEQAEWIEWLESTFDPDRW